MQLAAVTAVRNECDVIEAFVRHHAAIFDRLYILDHRSVDKTPDILRKLAAEGLPLVLGREEHGIFYQGPTMTRLIRSACDERRWDFVLPLDGDEFLQVASRPALEAALAGLDHATVGLLAVDNYIPTEADDQAEMDVLRRIGHHARTVPEISCKICKVAVPGAMIARPGFSFDEGNHGVTLDGKAVPGRRLDGVSLAHFPVRSIEQFTVRTIVSRLAWGARSDYIPDWGWNYRTYFEQLKAKPAVSLADLTQAALLYVDIYLDPEPTPYRRVLVHEPVTPAYDKLQYADLIDIAVLPPILDMMDVLVEELRRARNAGATGSKTKR